MWCGETSVQDTVPDLLEPIPQQDTPHLHTPVKTILENHNKEATKKKMTFAMEKKRNFVE